MSAHDSAASGSPLLLSPVALWSMASNFFEAACKLQGNQHVMPEHYPVVPYLLGHSIELALKAYLCCEGQGERALRGIGHDLVRALEEANAAGLSSHVSLTADQSGVIEALNELYERKELEYSTPLPAGGRLVTIPGTAVLIPVADALISGLRAHCLASLARLREARRP